MKTDFQEDPRFAEIRELSPRALLSSPTMHGEELQYMKLAYDTNWMTTLGENVDVLEEEVCKKIGRKYAVGLSCGTAALHLAIKIAAEKLYGRARPGHGTLEGKKVFCSDMTFDASINPVAYECGEAVFIDTEAETWNMSPEALAKAFEMYPDVKLVVYAHLYGVPGKIEELMQICHAHEALLVEDAAEAFGASYRGRQIGNFGDVSAISFNGNKIITGSSGGMLLTDEEACAHKVRKWSTQSREDAPWYEHEEIGYNYRISNVIAGVVRGQLPYLDEHIAQKKAIYERYRDNLRDLPVRMNPFDAEKSAPNYWLSCLLIDRDALCAQVRSEREALYLTKKGKSCPTEILEALSFFHAEGRPIWKPMHMQPIYQSHPFITKDGDGRARSNAYIREAEGGDVGADIFARGLCLPSDNKIPLSQIDQICEIIHRCFE